MAKGGSATKAWLGEHEDLPRTTQPHRPTHKRLWIIRWSQPAERSNMTASPWTGGCRGRKMVFPRDTQGPRSSRGTVPKRKHATLATSRIPSTTCGKMGDEHLKRWRGVEHLTVHVHVVVRRRHADEIEVLPSSAMSFSMNQEGFENCAFGSNVRDWKARVQASLSILRPVHKGGIW